MKKLLALILAILMITTMFIGCAKEADDDNEEKSDKKHSVTIKGDKEDADDNNEDKNKEDKKPLWPNKDDEKDEDKGNVDEAEKDEDNENVSDNEIVVGYTIYAPMNYKDETGNLVGFDTELAVAVFGGLGYQVAFKEIDWSQKYDEVNNGTIDCIWNGFASNVADDDGIMRSEKVDCSYNYMKLTYENPSEVEYYAIGFKQGSDLTDKVNTQLEKLAKDGTIAKLAEKYNVSATAITDFSDQKK